MILQLSSLFNTYPKKFCQRSNSGIKNDSIITNLNFIKANNLLLIFTIAWVIYQLNIFLSIATRPKELFYPAHYFGKIFMPSLPSIYSYFSIGILSILLILYTLFIRNHLIIRLFITFFILWLNLPENSFGKQCHTSHLLILSHLFILFIPIDQIHKNKDNHSIHKTIELYYLGLLITYFFSGFWKILGLAYKLIFKSEELNWLSPDASLYNALIGFREEDLTRDIYSIFSITLFWKISFLFATFILTFSFIAAYRQPLRIWAGAALIIFHMVNIFAFNVSFYTAQFVLLCLFFPYEKLFKNYSSQVISVTNNSFTGNKKNALYIRNYENGDKDHFEGFYAYREKITDKNRLIGGLLYTPFLDTFINILWAIKKDSLIKKLY